MLDVSKSESQALPYGFVVAHNRAQMAHQLGATFKCPPLIALAKKRPLVPTPPEDPPPAPKVIKVEAVPKPNIDGR